MAKCDLFDAIRKNSLRQMQLLLESGCEVDMRNGQSETPLMVAVYGLPLKDQRARAIKHLLKAGADVNARNGQGRTALTLACALDQADSVRLLLQQGDTDVNLGDVSGVTPLMVCAALGHRDTLNTLIECAGQGQTRLDLHTKDDSDWTAADYAAVSGHSSLVEHLKGRQPNKQSVRPANNRSLGNNVGGRAAPKGKLPGNKADQEMVHVPPSALKDSNLAVIQQLGMDVRALQAQSDTNLASINSSSSSRPSSRSTSSASTTNITTRPYSQDRTASRTASRFNNRSKERPASKASSRSKGSLTAEDDDDDDIELDLSSLRDLMGTVREAAKEIREIVEPLKKEKEKDKEQAGRSRQQKRRQRKDHSQNPGYRQQIQAEIHIISEINGHAIPPLPPATPLTPTAPYLEEENTHPPPVYLQVENEDLAHTWPRQKGQSVSRSRSRSSGTAMGSPSSEGSFPFTNPKYEPPRVPPHAAKNEMQILEKVVGRSHAGPDPLVAAINNLNATPKSRLIMESRQRMVGRARLHWSSHQPYSPQPQPPPLPHITVSADGKHADQADTTEPVREEDGNENSPEDRIVQDESGLHTSATSSPTAHDDFPSDCPSSSQNPAVPMAADTGPASKRKSTRGPAPAPDRDGGAKSMTSKKHGLVPGPDRNGGAKPIDSKKPGVPNNSAHLDGQVGPNAKSSMVSSPNEEPPALDRLPTTKNMTKPAPGKPVAEGVRAAPGKTAVRGRLGKAGAR